MQGNLGEESLRVSPKPTEKEAATVLTALSTPIKKKGKRQRQTPLYFRTRKITRIMQGQPQTSTKVPIVFEDSPKNQENIAPLLKNQGEGSSGQASPKSPITYVRRPVTRSASSK